MKNLLLIAMLALGACEKTESKPAKPATIEPAKLPVEGVKGRRVDVAVTKAGYVPDKVEVKTNEEVTLVFTMTEETECGSEIVIPSTGFKQKLQLGKPLAVPFKADQPGPVRFACGMDMMRGAIVVTN